MCSFEDMPGTVQTLYILVRGGYPKLCCIPTINQLWSTCWTCNTSALGSEGYKEKKSLKSENIDDIKKKTEALVQSSMKLGEAIYKSQQNAKPDSGKDDGKDEKEKKDDNVVDADFEEVKDENKEKSA